MLIHADLFVTSMDRSLDFYVDKMEFQKVEDTLVEGELVEFVSKQHYRVMRLVLLRPSIMGSMIELIEFQDSARLTESSYLPPPHHGSLTILVEDLDDRVQRLRAMGVEPASKVFTVQASRTGQSSIIFYKDPDDHAIELLQMHRS